LGRTQSGNNNAYCQDNELSWFDWEAIDAGLLDFTQRLVAFRRQHPVFRQRHWLRGRPIRGIGLSDIVWFSPSGDEMDERDWHNGDKSLAVFMNGMGIQGVQADGKRLLDDSFYLVFNPGAADVVFSLPASDWLTHWEKVLDTSEAQPPEAGQLIDAGEEISVPARTVVVYRHHVA
jgi:glycogen operon protein